LESEFGTESKTYIKDGFYLDVSNSTFMPYQLWRYIDTSVYFLLEKKSDTLWFSKTNFEEKEQYKYKLIKNVDTILGYKCDLLRVYKERSISEYYFSPDLGLDPSFYENYTRFNKYQILKQIKSV